VQAGHPYLTDELDAKRAEQRRALRSIPSWIVDTTRISRPGPPLGGTDAALVEIELRRLADQDLEPLRSWVTVWQGHTESEAIEWWIGQAELNAALEDVARQVRADHEAKRAAEYPPGLYSRILRVVTLLAWADELAGDYADPRLDLHRAHWHSNGTRVASG
jgi:hypothetical protein